MCKSCVWRCREIITPEQAAEIECPSCDGTGFFSKDVPCDECTNGIFTLTECPAKYIGSELIQDIQIVSACEHHLPVAGGLLDQSAWWFELKETLRREENRVQDEQSKRRNR